MTYSVLLTRDADQDLEALYDYLYWHDSPESTGYVLDQIEQALNSLKEHPQRGVYPKELASVGIREYREIYFKPYRLIYRILADKVYIMVIADGRRDMQSLLQRRILNP